MTTVNVENGIERDVVGWQWWVKVTYRDNWAKRTGWALTRKRAYEQTDEATERLTRMVTQQVKL